MTIQDQTIDQTTEDQTKLYKIMSWYKSLKSAYLKGLAHEIDLKNSSKFDKSIGLKK